MMKPAIIAHGGAGDVPLDLAKKRLDGVIEAVSYAWDLLISGDSALNAVVEAVRIMEDNPWLNAGRGSSLNADGYVEMDALVMDGTTLKAGAVAAVRRIRNPILLARLVMERTNHILLVGEGAEKFAQSQGMKLVDPEELIVPYQREKWEKAKMTSGAPIDTVGAVALDFEGNIAVAVSTGGLFMKLPGRVGDTPIIGAGGYADSNIGGACATGLGEAAMRVLLSKKIVDLLEMGYDPQTAARMGIEYMEKRTNGSCGVIVLDKFGRVGFYKNTRMLLYAYKTKDKFDAQIYI
ncbi:MAG: isoaspartyl peptidase/L-asparaginase [Candidatus Korarchaeota archaeon]|nr:isoaspartyl peptidase/L-asparaginase [Thermoproteota archaeon]